MSKSDLASLSYLDEIPDNIYQRLVTHQYRMLPVSNEHDSLHQRVQGVLNLRIQLLKGEVPEYSSLLHWLDTRRAEVLFDKLKGKDILKNAFDNESYTDDYLLSLLIWLDHGDNEIDWNTGSNKLNSNNVNSKHHENTQNESVHDSENRSVGKVNDGINVGEFSNDKLQGSMHEINTRFALQRSVGWDLMKDVNSYTDLNTLVTFHKSVKNSKQIQSIIRIIGRNKKVFIDQYSKTRLNQIESEKCNIPDDRAVKSVTGLCLGDDVSKMLSTDLAQLGSNKLKMLWHARRAEHLLLNYHYQGLLSDHVPDIEPLSLDYDLQSGKLVKSSGPIILCVDTSASMKGRAEFISKAIAFEMMRVAHLQKRGCYLFCFGGTDEIVQLELNLDSKQNLNDGWGSILKFLGFSFNGGTDINNVILQALDVQKLKRWNNADLLLVSDGLFKVDNALDDRLLQAKKSLQIFGIQLGKWHSTSLRDICHSVFHISDV